MFSFEYPRFILFTVLLFSGQRVRNDTQKQHRPIIPSCCFLRTEVNKGQTTKKKYIKYTNAFFYDYPSSLFGVCDKHVAFVTIHSCFDCRFPPLRINNQAFSMITFAGMHVRAHKGNKKFIRLRAVFLSCMQISRTSRTKYLTPLKD